MLEYFNTFNSAYLLFAAEIMFPTGSPGPAPYDPSSVQAMVKYGYHSGDYKYFNFGRYPRVYNQIYGASSGNMTYQSPIFHHVLLVDLTPGRTVYYIVGNDKDGWSNERSFPVFDDSKTSTRIAVWGDIGQTSNSSLTLDALAARNPDLILNLADFTYAGKNMLSFLLHPLRFREIYFYVYRLGS